MSLLDPVRFALKYSAALVATSLVTLAGAAPAPPNIVYVNADDLGWADLGCYGNPFNRTPAIDRLATEGMRFTQAYSCAPACTPSRAGLNTGQHPARLHMTGQASYYRDPPDRMFLHPQFRLELPANIPTVAQMLTDAGYTCVALGKWGLGQHTEGHGYERVTPGKDEDLTRMAVEFISRPHDKPFFLIVNYHWVHSPLRPDPKFEAEARKRAEATGAKVNPRYSAIVAQLDDGFSQIYDAIDKAGLRANTLFIFVSDNGGFLGADDEPYTTNGTLHEGKASLYEGGVRVPFIARLPGVIPAGTVCDSPVNDIDTMPTFAALCGARIPDAAIVDGEDISPLLRGTVKQLPPRDMFWHFPHYRRAMAGIAASPSSSVRHGDWKLIHFHEDNHDEVYNLNDDPGEKHDLSMQMPIRTKELRRLLDDWLAGVGAQPPFPNPLYNFKES